MSDARTHAATAVDSTMIRGSRDFAVVANTIVFRVVRDELCVGLPWERVISASERGVRRIAPAAAPQASAGETGLEAAARLAAAQSVSPKELVRIAHAGVRTLPTVVEHLGQAPSATLSLVSWAIARPVPTNAPLAIAVEADENFVPLSTLPALDDAARIVLTCAFDAFLDATLADALTRRLLPRHVLFHKTDGFQSRSPFESGLAAGGATEAEGATGAIASEHAPDASAPHTPIFVGLLPDPFPLSMLRELYERLLGAPLDRGNFRRQFHEIIAHGPIKALPIFERGVPHRAGQLFTFDRAAWARFAAK